MSKFSELVDGYNLAKEAYLDTHEANPERQSQITVVDRMIDSFPQKRDMDASKLLIFLHVLAESIAVTPFFGHSDYKVKLQDLVSEHLPTDAEEIAKYFNRFNSSCQCGQIELEEVFKGSKSLGKTFVLKFQTLFDKASRDCLAVQTQERINNLSPIKNSDKSMFKPESKDIETDTQSNSLHA